MNAGNVPLLATTCHYTHNTVGDYSAWVHAYIFSYHTGPHTGLPAAQPGHGGGHGHLLGGEGGVAGLGDVGVRGAVVHIV